MADDRPSPLSEQLRTRLRFAMKDRDQPTVSALRGALAAIDGAESAGIAAPDLSREESPIAGSRQGLGAAEAPRRQLTEDDVATIVRDEIVERETAEIAYRRAGESARADRLRAEAAALRAIVGPD